MSRDHARIERFRLARKNPDLAVLEGFHALKHAVRFGASILEVVSSQPGEIRGLAVDLAPDLAPWVADRVEPVEPATFEVLAPAAASQGVMAIAARPGEPSLRAWEQGARPVVLLDRPRHLGNLGATIRVAAAAGADGVAVLGEVNPWHPTALRGAAGLHFALPCWRFDELPPTRRPLVAMVAEGSASAPSPSVASAILAFGSERSGLGPELLARAEEHCQLPMRPGVSSLNLATAVAVALYLVSPPA